MGGLLGLEVELSAGPRGWEPEPRMKWWPYGKKRGRALAERVLRPQMEEAGERRRPTTHWC